MMCEVRPKLFAAGEGHWGLAGWTHLNIAAADEATVRHALVMAYRNVAPKRLAAAIPQDAAGGPLVAAAAVRQS